MRANRLTPQRLLPLGLALAALSNCSSRTNTCSPGQSLTCVGAGGCQGGQVCNANGQSFGACQCAQGSTSSGSASTGTTSSGSSTGGGSTGSTALSTATGGLSGAATSGTSGAADGGIPTQIGKPCLKNSDCLSGYCTQVGGPIDAGRTGYVCSEPCVAVTDCVPGWDCSPIPGISSSDFCTCTYSPEVCNGRDDDCNGIVDDEPAADQACGATSICDSDAGSCECSPVACNTATDGGATCCAGECTSSIFCAPGGGSFVCGDGGAYPAPPYGTGVGETLPDFLLGQGYWNPSAVPTFDVPASNPQGFANPALAFHMLYCSGFRYALVDVAAVWNPRSNDEAKQLPGWTGSAYQYSPDAGAGSPTGWVVRWLPMGGIVLSVLEQGADPNFAATPADLTAWIQRYAINYPMAIDPQEALPSALGLQAWPANVIVDLSNMRVVQAVFGDYPQFFSTFDSILSQDGGVDAG